MDSIDFYQTLEIHSDSSLTEIKSSYQKLLLKYHPDKQIKLFPSNNERTSYEGENSNEKFHAIQEAWKVLSNDSLRKEYDDSRMLLTQQKHSIRLTDKIRLNSFDNHRNGLYSYQCRCGDLYEITDEDIELGFEVIQCNGCTLHITITYD
eukprot:gene15525-20957_t